MEKLAEPAAEIDPGSEVRPVVQVKAAQKHLIGFATTAVLRNDESGYCLENIAGPKPRPRINFGLSDDAL
jgi:hypothetical protein